MCAADARRFSNLLLQVKQSSAAYDDPAAADESALVEEVAIFFREVRLCRLDVEVDAHAGSGPVGHVDESVANDGIRQSVDN